MPSPSTNSNLRLRVFAGPNGSGKSTVINSVKNLRVNNKNIDFGIYINADDIARQLRAGLFTFHDYEITTNAKEFTTEAIASGLVTAPFDEDSFKASFYIWNNSMKLKVPAADERLAQVTAHFLRKKLLREKRKFSFETVFSHPSKLDIMREAVAAGYKVYLYFVSTESAEINKYRVLERKAKGGHDVPQDKIVSRYYRSLDLLFEASQIAYQGFFWDNSIDGSAANLFAHFKKSGGQKQWDKINNDAVPNWFLKYYSAKVKKRRK